MSIWEYLNVTFHHLISVVIPEIGEADYPGSIFQRIILRSKVSGIWIPDN
jgi:hypothetical protein